MADHRRVSILGPVLMIVGCLATAVAGAALRDQGAHAGQAAAAPEPAALILSDAAR